MKKKDIAAAMVILSGCKLKERKKRSVWVSEWILRRQNFGAYHQLMKELVIEDPAQFRNFLRMTPSTFEELVRSVSPLICKQDTRLRVAISAQERLALTLRYLASGDSYASLSYLFRLPKCTICIIVPEVCKAITEVLRDKYMEAPSTPDYWLNISETFEERWNFPKCCGALDGKHVVLQSPAHAGSYFYNYKGQHSVVLMAVVDAEYKFIIVSIGSNGRASDGGIFAASGLSTYVEKSLGSIEKSPLPGRSMPVPNVIVADDAFPLKSYLLKPFPYNSEGSKRIFNYRLSRARRIVENVFGILSAVFRVLRKPLLLTPDRVDTVVFATCCLHNFLMSNKASKDIYVPEGTLDTINSAGQVEHGTWREEGLPTENLLPIAQQGSGNYSFNAKDIREEFRQYFISTQGEVQWQYGK